MKSIKKIVALSFVFVMFSCFVSWAGTKHVTTDEYDPRNMTWEERAEWVDANVPKTHYEALVALFNANSEWLLTEETYSDVGTAQYTTGTMRTKVKFVVDRDAYAVKDWATAKFEADVLSPYASVVDKAVNQHWMGESGNLRIIYEAWYLDPTGTRFIEHWYNLHGSGAYDVQTINGEGPTEVGPTRK